MQMFFPTMPSGLTEVPWFVGCGAVVRRDVFEQMGGYREEYFAYWEEVELSLRIWNKGYRIVLDPTVEFVHSMSSVNRSAATTTFYFTRNAIWLCRSAYSGSRALRYALVLTMLNFGAAMRSKDLLVAWAFACGVVQGMRTGPERLTLDTGHVSICTRYMDKLFGLRALGARIRDAIPRPTSRRSD
jgi:GT2 family glycosyltransferase